VSVRQRGLDKTIYWRPASGERSPFVRNSSGHPRVIRSAKLLWRNEFPPRHIAGRPAYLAVAGYPESLAAELQRSEMQDYSFGVILC